MLKFEWDEKKNQLNIQKHGVSFQEAITVFKDENAVILTDDVHSENEERFLLIGLSHKFNILVVCHCYRNNDTIIRIISARKAIKNERENYLEKL